MGYSAPPAVRARKLREKIIVMNDQNKAYMEAIAAGGNAYVRNLAGAERAIGQGQFNVAKVLRAAAHTQRTLAMQAARQLASELSAVDLLTLIQRELSVMARLPGVNEAARTAMTHIVDRSLASLEANPDILEADVPIILTGCYNCGIVIERGGLEICPHCGALGVELEWFGPFYAETAEHLGQLTPAEIIAAFREMPDQVAAAIDGVSDETLSDKPGPDEWCAKEIIAHMFETDIAFQTRAGEILAGSGMPVLSRALPPWMLHEGKGYELLDGDQLLGLMRKHKSRSLALVEGLSDQEWMQRGTLMGSVTSLLDLGTWVANHDIGHLAQIKRLCGK